MSRCGCIVLPDPIVMLGGQAQAMCEHHGWQDVIRRITPREAANLAQDLPLDFDPGPLPDDPPFLSAIPT